MPLHPTFHQSTIMYVLALLLLSCLTAVGLTQPVCLCATDNSGSFKALLTAPNDPFKYPPMVENIDTTTFRDFHDYYCYGTKN